MALHKVSRCNHGFTIIEIGLVIALLSIIGTFSLMLSMDNYRASSFNNDRNMVISLLQKARSQAVNNMCLGAACTEGVAHGLHIETGSYTIFQGTAYNPADALNEKISMPPTLTFSGLANVVFTELSGSPVAAGTITLSDGMGHTSTIDINSEGRIAWTN
jgi:Tfp pilus assembly protein FimT